MRLLVAAGALAWLVACVGAPDSVRTLRFQKAGDESPRGTRVNPEDAAGAGAPSGTEKEAVHRMQKAIATAERLQRTEALSEEEHEALTRSLDGARAALERYRSARRSQMTHTATLATIGAAAAAIVADDATVVGVADDPLLIPLALAALVAVIRSNAPSARDELARAWLELGQQLEMLRETLTLTSPGKVVHDYLVDEARKRAIRRAAAQGVVLTESQVKDEMLCDELERMAREFRRANKLEDWKKANSTQKGLKCRPSRHNRE
jgi:hypothetical protein